MRVNNSIDSIIEAIDTDHYDVFDDTYHVAIADTEEKTIKDIVADILHNIVGFSLVIFDEETAEPLADFFVESRNCIEADDALMSWDAWKDFIPGSVGIHLDPDSGCIGASCYARYVQAV